ncbi:PHP domain-containing protein [Alicyclobacillus tolerans]|uniref:PHP domain-containing protein n=1 Tax=Alicyclobacillus tolerans TaxID=90970 RepID=UPI001F013FE6|nr:PHP domain-containing protein [Alicyclobacillus tolerans]MCF8566148.1 PHP domain-containing protein [Alicyclobacillus tolerans]
MEFVVNAKDPSALLDWASVRQSASNEASTIDNRTQTLDCTVEIEDKKVPLRFHLAEARDFPYRLMETTGDATHQQIVEAMAKERGLHWTKGRLFDAMGQPVQCETEAQIYEVLGLPYFPPELREGQGLLIDPEELVDANDIRGDLHTHSSWSDGTLPIRTMALAAQARGYEYIAVTDHSQSLAIAGGLTAEDLLRQREEIERLNDELSGIKILHGIEVDILGDGTLDMPDEVLWELDLVIASVHSAMNQSPKRMTERILKAIEHPAVDIIGHLSGRLIGRREAYGLDFSAVLETAKQSRVCLELNANPNRLDIPDSWLRLAGEAGLLVPINTDAHSAQEYDNIRFGLRMAKRGWLHRQRVLNALPLNELTSLLHRKRKRQ